MKLTTKRKEQISSVLIICLGNILNAFSARVFLLPADLVAGGTTGIGLILQRITGIPLSSLVLAFNIIMLVLAYIFLGKKYTLSAILSSFMYPIALEFFNQILRDYVLTDNLILCTLFAGIGIGISLGMIIRTGASTGGVDVPPLILNKYFRFPVSAGLYIIDFFVILGQALYQPVDKVLYAILYVIIYPLVMNKLIVSGTSRIAVQIISKHSDEIRNFVLTQIDRGATIIPVQGGYLNQQLNMVLTVISNRELVQLEKMFIRSIRKALSSFPRYRKSRDADLIWTNTGNQSSQIPLKFPDFRLFFL